MANDASARHSMSNEELRNFYQTRGFAGRAGFGERPAILVIDLARAWTDLASPIATDLSRVIDETNKLLGPARAKQIPIFFTTMAYDPDARDCGDVVLKKLPLQKMMVRGSKWVELDSALDVQPEDVLIEKQRGSAFFGTSLLSQLIAHKIDTLIITGCSTSGCVRSTAQTAHDYNLHVIVPLEAVGDRSPTAHEANLFDIDSRMADVVSVADVQSYIGELSGSR